jgi:arginine deiminase
MLISSEVNRLKKVILHSPDLALKHLTPNNCQSLLFDDVLWVEKAQQEHAYFQQLMTDKQVEVFLVKTLMQEMLSNGRAKETLIQERVNDLHFGASFARQLTDFLSMQSEEILADYLLGGLTLEEMRAKPLGLLTMTLSPHDFVLPPLPNHLFTRDSSCWIGKGVSINSMCFVARHGEALNMAAIYRFHPMFEEASFQQWSPGSDDSSELPSIEGGDVLVISEDCVLIGLSQRTTPGAIEYLARQLFSAKDKRQIIAVEIPKTRASMHLDTLLTMVNHDTFCTAMSKDMPGRAWSIYPPVKGDYLHIEEERDVFDAIRQALNLDKLELIYPTGDHFSMQREQWNDSLNLLAIAPGTVIAYDRNVEMNAKLKSLGITVYEIPGAELGRGRGGSRCMSCPLERE